MQCTLFLFISSVMDEPEVIISLYLIGLPIVLKCLPLLNAFLFFKGQYTVYTAQHAVKKSSNSQDSVLFEADLPHGKFPVDPMEPSYVLTNVFFV